MLCTTAAFPERAPANDRAHIAQISDLERPKRDVDRATPVRPNNRTGLRPIRSVLRLAVTWWYCFECVPDNRPHCNTVNSWQTANTLSWDEDRTESFLDAKGYSPLLQNSTRYQKVCR